MFVDPPLLAWLTLCRACIISRHGAEVRFAGHGNFMDVGGLERPRQALPFPLELAAALVGRCVEVEHLHLACCLCLGFWGMLRTGEIFALRFRHLLIRDQCMIVRLGETKTGIRRQVDRNAVIQRGPTVLIGETLLGFPHSSGDNVWPLPRLFFARSSNALRIFLSCGTLFVRTPFGEGEPRRIFEFMASWSEACSKADGPPQDNTFKKDFQLTKLTLSRHTQQLFFTTHLTFKGPSPGVVERADLVVLFCYNQLANIAAKRDMTSLPI